jgi:hypothetical protein
VSKDGKEKGPLVTAVGVTCVDHSVADSGTKSGLSEKISDSHVTKPAGLGGAVLRDLPGLLSPREPRDSQSQRGLPCLVLGSFDILPPV